MEKASLEGKKAVFVIAPKDFRDEEYFDTKKVLEEHGVSITTSSKNPGEIRGMMGGSARADVTLNDVNIEEFDALVFIGGVGAQVYFDDSVAHSLAIRALEKKKIVAAICIAPVILANAGILGGKRATCFDGEYARRIEEKGADYTGEDVVRDENIITGNGPTAATQFAKEIVKALSED